MPTRVAAAVAAVAALLSGGTAQASFPGANGRIAFTSDRDALDLEVYSMAADGSSQTNLTNQLDDDSQPAWSASGQRIAFTSVRDLDEEIYVMNADGTQQTRLTANRASDTAPAWSLDGGKIAFTSDRAGAFNLDIYVTNADGTQQTALTTDPGLDTGAAWSPVGSRIAFTSTRDGDSEIFVMGADGSGQVALTANTVTDSGPEWSPNGQRIAFSSTRDGNSEIYVMNADGTGQARLTSNPASDVGPAWSPDGQKIAFRSKRDGNWEIYSMSTDGTGQTRLTSNPALEIDPDWQPAPPVGYPRPGGASPIRASLVPAYGPCESPNRTHGGPLAYDSCNPPGQTSSSLTVGTPDANNAGANMIGSVRLKVCPVPGCTAPDVNIQASTTDVRCRPGVATCGSANNADGADYTGEVLGNVTLRITDKYSGASHTDPATVTDTSLAVTIPCAATDTDPSKGASCSVTTTANSVLPGSVTAGKRAIWEFGRVEVYDGGPDGDADTTADNAVFLTQGVFVP